MGFFEDVQEILSAFKKPKRMWMFSATMPKPILNLIKKDFKNPQVIMDKHDTSTNIDIEQRYYIVRPKNKREALCLLLDSLPDIYAIVFCRTRMDTKELADELLSRGYNAESLHGEMSQAQRESAMMKFKSRKANLMICTDVAARGIDVNNLTHVINFGLPLDQGSYLHRIGRTGRAGMKGIAITLLEPSHVSLVKRLERFVRAEIKLCRLPQVTDLKKNMVNRELQSISTMMEAVVDKGDEFKLDPTFQVFQNSVSHLSKDELLKLMFTWKFNKDLRRYDSLSSLDDISSSRSSSSNSRSRKSMDYTRKRNIGSGQVRLFLNVGKEDGLRLNVLLKHLARNTGINKEDIQNVDMKKRFSFFNIPKRYGKTFLQLKSLKINNRQVRMEYSQ